jgi:hypothetical protein
VTRPLTGQERALAGLEAFAALNAFAGATYGLAGAENVPLEWLEDTPFSDYTIPSAILGTVVGGSMTTGAIAVWQRNRLAGELSMAAGGILATWIAVQVTIWRGRSWMQPASLAAGLVTAALGERVRRATR